MATGFATVKEVVSGDTLVLVGKPQNGPPPEIRLTLASVVAPRLGGGKGLTEDEAFAWQSREFLRALCIGKAVQFKVEWSVPSINRQFGAVRLTTGNKENVCVTVARAGWCRVKKDDKEPSGDYEEIAQASSMAESQGLGVFGSADSSAFRNVVNGEESLLPQVKGVAQHGIIEYVRDGASFKVYLVEKQANITLCLAGVQCPRVQGSDGVAEPYGLEARYFTEVRLLNRDVQVVVNGYDSKSKAFYGTVIHPNGDIGVELCKSGLGKCVDWSMQWCGNLTSASLLRAAQREAKTQKLRVWKNHQVSEVSGEKGFQGIVQEVVSGDTLVVRVGDPEELKEPWGGREIRVTLSSIRCARVGFKGEPDEPYARQALDLARKLAVGKKCDVSIEYERAASETAITKTPRNFGTVLVAGGKKKKNIATALVEEGLAEVVRHRAEDDRSAFYDELSMAQQAAKDGKKGRWSDAPASQTQARRIVDLSSNAVQAKSNLPALQQSRSSGLKAGQHKGIVEFVISAVRMRILLPLENTLVSFALGGVLGPKQGEPFYAESVLATRSLVVQREVVIDIETMDKNGTIIGQLLVQNENLGLFLVKNGLGMVNDYTARFTSVSSELAEFQKDAREKKLFLWTSYVEPVKKDDAVEEDKMDVSKLCVVSEITSGNNFFLQSASPDKVAVLETIQQTLKDIGKTDGVLAGGPGTGLLEYKKNAMCLALFHDDVDGLQWFRAKITAVNKDQSGIIRDISVRYVDFGNSATLSQGHLRPLPDKLAFAPPLAEECTLAYLQVPDLDKDYGQQAAVFLSQLVFNNKVHVVYHHSKNTDVKQVSLFAVEQGGGKTDVTKSMLEQGLAFLKDTDLAYFRDMQLLSSWREAQDQAHRMHTNMWRYGDPRSEDF